jgi:uncharacterized GH25 family protein
MKGLTKLLAAVPVVLATAIWWWISAVHAHEFIIKPAALRVNAGDKVPFSVLSTHVFMSGEELLSANTVKASLLEGNKSVDLPLKENNILQTLDGTATVHAKGTAVIAGHLLEPVENLTAQDTGRAQRARFEKFSKSLIVVEASDRNYEKVLGHRLEIVPTTDPTAARIGDELVFRILFDGKPLQTNVFATYDGFSRFYNTYAYATESRDGIARVKITHPGAWLVRVERRMAVVEKDYDLHVLKAILVFPVE